MWTQYFAWHSKLLDTIMSWTYCILEICLVLLFQINAFQVCKILLDLILKNKSNIFVWSIKIIILQKKKMHLNWIKTRYDSNRMLLRKVSQTSPIFFRVLMAILKMAEILKILKMHTCSSNGDLSLCQILCLYHYPFRSYQH